MCRVCNSCGQSKSFDEFAKRSGVPSGIRGICKECKNSKTRSASWYQKKRKTKRRLCRVSEDGRFKECTSCKQMKPLAQFFKAKIGQFGRAPKCKDCSRLYQKNHRVEIQNRVVPIDGVQVCKSCGEEKSVKLFRPDKRTCTRRSGVCYQCLGKQRESSIRSDVNQSIRKALRSRINCAIRAGCKAGSTVKDLGCTIPELRVYLESKFYDHPKTGEKMTWENWSFRGWHIDHIQNLATFDLANREEFLKAAHYSNLQPLWVCDHLVKSASE